MWRQGVVQSAEGFEPFSPKDVSRSIVDLFEQQAERSAGNAAIASNTQTISYSELNTRANIVAHLLLERFNAPHATVAVVMEHGSEKVIAAIGVLKAALVLVPLDSSLTDRDIAEHVRHSQSKIVLTDVTRHDRLVRLFNDSTSVVLFPDEKQPGSDENPRCLITPKTPVRIGYTSGSTGSPKGVLQSNGQNLQLVKTLINTMKIGPTDRVLFLQNFYFDILFAPLLTGATIYPFDIRKQSFFELLQYIREKKITTYFGIATGFRQFISNLDSETRLSSFRAIGLIGEPMYTADVTDHRRVFPSTCALINFYGTTEHGHISYFVVGSSNDLIHDSIVPAGFAPEGIHIMVIDGNRGLVESGELGEVAIHGKYLDTIYWNDPELTCATWVCEPSLLSTCLDQKNCGDERIYLTGDLAYLDKNNCLHIKGRKDETLKIRGYRVLPSVIENAMLRHEEVKHVAVVAIPGYRRGEEKLACYYVPVDRTSLTQDSLRSFLMSRIPEYMVPSVYLPVDNMPLTRSGKIARHALPAPEFFRDHLNDNSDKVSRAAASTGMSIDRLEDSLQLHWQSLLGIRSVSMTDDFISQGGDSLAAMRLSACLKIHYGIDVPFHKILGNCTVESLVKTIKSKNIG